MIQPRAAQKSAPQADKAHPARPRRSLLPAPTQWCRCFLCKELSAIPLPLTPGQPNWIECEYCGLDNEIPEGTAGRTLAGQVPTRFF